MATNVIRFWFSGNTIAVYSDQKGNSPMQSPYMATTVYVLIWHNVYSKPVNSCLQAVFSNC